MKVFSDEKPNEENLVEKLRIIWSLSKENESMSPQIGLLTTENRKIWGGIRNQLLKSEIKS